MTQNIFYSWQSDRPNRTTRGFIEDAIKKAIRNIGSKASEIYAPPRDLKFDKDTKGMAGSPPISDTIFRKIEECAVFIPDLTFCGATDDSRLTPNSNVLIEYGWALAKLGHERIVAVMNSAYGEPTGEILPFNIRHTRWPHHFRLPEHHDPDTRQVIKAKLILYFEEALQAALSVPPSDVRADFRMQPKSSVSSFIEGGDILGHLPPEHGNQRPKKVEWRDGARQFLRLVPHQPVGPYPNIQLKEMVDREPLTPFGGPKQRRRRWMGNEWGGVVFEPGGEDRTSADYVVQISQHGEIWGIDNYYLQPKRIADEAKEFEKLGIRDRTPTENVVPFFEDDYAQALSEYFRFARRKLMVTSPVTIVAGMTDIQGFQTYLPRPRNDTRSRSERHRVGCAAKRKIIFTIDEVSLEPDSQTELECNDRYAVHNDALFRYAYKTLIPFFEHAWSEFEHRRLDFLPK